MISIAKPDGSSPGTTTKAKDQNRIQIKLDKQSVLIENEGQTLYSGTHDLSPDKARYAGVRFLAKPSDKPLEDLTVPSVRISNPDASSSDLRSLTSDPAFCTISLAVTESQDLQAALPQEAYQQLQDELSKVIVGQTRVIEELLIAIFAAATASCRACPWPKRCSSPPSPAMEFLSPHSVHPRPDASDITGTDILQEDVERPPQIRISKRPDFRQHAFG
jgi:hypothetical protein